MTKFFLDFENKSRGIFYSGQKISGILQHVNDKNRKILSVSITFEGNAKSQWEKRQGQYSSQKYRGREHFVKEEKFLLPKDVKGKEQELSKGIYEYPFSFIIPNYFPTSVEAFDSKFRWGESVYGLQGYVRYFLIVKVERFMSSEIKSEFPITIIKNFDLNYADPRYRTLTSFEGTKTFSLSSKPPLFMSVDAPVCGFVCGEKSKFFVSYRNESGTDVDHTKIELVRISYLTSNEPKIKTKIGTQEITSAKFEGVPKKSTKNIEVYITIPSVAPTSDGSCKVLKIAYEIQISACFGGFSSDLTLKIPIIIGTVPYLPSDMLNDSSVDCVENETQETRTVQPTRPIQQHNIRSIFTRDQNSWSLGPSTSSVSMPRPSAPMPTTPEDYDMPPTYMEAIGARSSDIPGSDNNQQLNFTPSYPVYNFDQIQK